MYKYWRFDTEDGVIFLVNVPTVETWKRGSNTDMDIEKLRAIRNRFRDESRNIVSTNCSTSEQTDIRD